MSSLLVAVFGAVLGAVITDVAAPLVVRALGFEAGGIAKGSIGAWIMSILGTCAIVRILQSIGAAGFSAAGYVVLSIVGGAIGTAIKMCFFS